MLDMQSVALLSDPPAATEIDGRWAAVDLPGRGTTFACDRPASSPDAPTVVLLHGWTATGSLNWAATINALGDRYRVVALDHRGHGRGIRGDTGFTLEDCADDAVALLDLIGAARAMFVGYSMGGPIAQLIWRRHPDRVAGLVLCATAADFTPVPEQRRVVRALEELERAASLIPRPLRLQLARPIVTALIADPAIRNELWAAICSHDERAIREAGREIRRFSSTDWIGAIDVPVAVVVTERDRLVPPALQRQLAALIPGATTISLDGAHLATFTDPELAAAAVVAACDSVTAPTSTRSRRRIVERLRRFLRGHRPRLIERRRAHRSRRR